MVNSPFSTEVDPNADLPWWRTPDMIALAKQIATYLGIGAVALFLYFVMVKPALRRAFPPPEPAAVAALASPDEPILLDGIPAAERMGANGGSVAELGNRQRTARPQAPSTNMSGTRNSRATSRARIEDRCNRREKLGVR